MRDVVAYVAGVWIEDVHSSRHKMDINIAGDFTTPTQDESARHVRFGNLLNTTLKLSYSNDSRQKAWSRALNRMIWYSQ
jgi:hypothetical protein